MLYAISELWSANPHWQMEDWEREVWCLNVKYEEKAGLLLGLVPEWLLVHSSKNSVTNSHIISTPFPTIYKSVTKIFKVFWKSDLRYIRIQGKNSTLMAVLATLILLRRRYILLRCYVLLWCVSCLYYNHVKMWEYVLLQLL